VLTAIVAAIVILVLAACLIALWIDARRMNVE
jgi:hypothetical protein